MPMARTINESFETRDGSRTKKERYAGNGCEPAMLSTMSLIGSGVMMASGAAERDTRKRMAMDHRYGRISRRDLRTVPLFRDEVPEPRRPERARRLAARARATTTAHTIHATIGTPTWRRRSRDSESRERPRSHS